jgi:diguanylate cyclase (GGDEF)-like protein
MPSVLRLLLASLALFVLTGGAGVRAQAPESGAWRERADPTFRHVALPTTMLVTQMLQADDGILWLGTQSGLVRWDGYRFKTFVADADTPGSLPDSMITALHKDSRGRIWIGTSAGGVARMDEANQRFAVMTDRANDRSHASIFALADDGQGGLWIGSGAGLERLDRDGILVPGYTEVAHAVGLPEGAVQSLLVDRAGALWAGMRNGLFRRAPDGGRFEPVALAAGEDSTPFVARLMQDGDGRLWVGTRDHGVFTIAPGHAGATPLRETESGSAGLASDTISELVEVAPGDIWIGTSGGGIVRVDTRHGSTRRVRHHDQLPASLSDDDVYLIFRDRSGLLWVGTGSAISAWDPGQRGVSTWFGYAGSPDGVTHGNVSALLAMPDGSAWLGLGDGGIDVVDPHRGRTARLRPDPRRPLSALPKGRVLAMAIAPSGDVWLGTQQGLYRADATGRTVARVDVPGRKGSAATWALCVDGDMLWIGGLDGLWGLRMAQGEAPRIVARQDGDTLGEPRVTSLALAPQHRLWVGTRAGLLRFDPASGAVMRLPLDAPGRIGLPGGYITSVRSDSRGRLWVASFGGGVRVVDGAHGGAPSIRRVSVKEGLPNNGVNALLLDAHDDAWISTDDGLARIRGVDLSVTPMRDTDGVGIATYWTNSAAQTPSGALLFGGTGGLTAVDPRAVLAWTFSPPLVVTAVGGNAGTGPATWWSGGAAAPLQLEPRDRNLLVEFAALDYSDPQSNRYAYRLLGFDDEWIAADAGSRVARYNNLPPGHYVLELRGSNRQGLWSTPRRQAVDVRPTWNETGWFRAGLGVVALLLVVALVQARTLVLRRRQQVLELLVARRTEELERRSAELRDSERRLEQMAYHDGLTGLANRRLFNDDLKALHARSQRREPFSLLLIDLDKFKQVNDTQGHDAGDALLCAVAERLSGAVRDIDRVARLGGDEFAVLLTNVGQRQDVEIVCRRILDSLGAPVLHRGLALRASASIGVASCPLDADTPEDLYKLADVALYRAKEAGRDRWSWSRQEEATASQ